MEQRARFYETVESDEKAKFGTSQWSDDIYNILTKNSNCRNDCKYCYMKRIRHNLLGVDIEDLTMDVNTKKVEKKWLKPKASRPSKYIMFPSSHGIFAEYVEDYIKVAEKILVAGHDLLVVTKPRRECIQRISEALESYKGKIVFRLTITSDMNDVLELWEPNAPKFEERLECLQMLHARGFKTSVSIEPFLSDPLSIVSKVDQYVTDSIWVGYMSGMGYVKDVPESEVKRVKELYKLSHTDELVKKLSVNPKIYWKSSIMNKKKPS